MNWSLVLCRTDGTALSDLPDAHDRKVTFKLNGSAQVDFTLPGSSTSAALLQELNTDVIVLCDGKALTRCRVGSTSDELDENQHDISVSALDYLSLLDRRYFMTANTYTGLDLTAIAWDLIDYTQHRVAWPGGDWGITRGLTAVTKNVDFTVDAGKKIGEAIDDLHSVDPGFDYEVDAGLRFNVWSFRGTKRDFALDYGSNLSKLTRTIDPAAYANAVRQSGADGVPAAERIAPDLADRPEGRFEQQEGNTDLDNAQVVGWTADAYLERHGTLLPSYEATINPAAGWTPDKLWLGDTATLVVRSGRLDVVSEERVFQIDVELTDDGAVDVTLGFGEWRQSLLQWFKTVPQQIEQINRR